ncbi:hypothetical protein CRG98_022009 [Punica granatum]|uniref:Uncharacterized protein n=1 Tax=Punica granatum TaxID=22663 RepID=A0A2I0JMM8_PUNGR|nr:hypothetical protein CRG98_022009 [Punica granatum]
MGRGPLAGGGWDRQRRQRWRYGRRFAPLNAATAAQEGAGDSSGRCLGHVVSGLDFTEEMTILPPSEPIDRNGVLTKSMRMSISDQPIKSTGPV